MDLWSVTTDFFLKQIKAGQFRITDIMALANQLNVQLKPPRNSNADQIIFLVQDLLDDLKQRRYPPLSMASSMTKMKQHPPLEKLGLEFRDLLMMEMVQDQHKEISRYVCTFKSKTLYNELKRRKTVLFYMVAVCLRKKAKVNNLLPVVSKTQSEIFEVILQSL